MNGKSKERFSLLVADDSVDDRVLLKAAMKQAKRLEIIAEVSDGAEVVNYLGQLAGRRDRPQSPLPDLLLLDLKMPVKDGFEVLEWLRTQPPHDMAVVVLTNSVKTEHIQRALDLGADLFQVKPCSQNEFVAMILALEDYLINRPRASRPLRTIAHLVPRFSGCF